jgi:poly(ADP-ribose) glycohydrolase ARH3
MTEDRFVGCMLGLATGDALGAPHEGGMLERSLWRLIGRTRGGHLRWTDDTQMALDLAESLLEEDGLRPDALARRFAASYRWSRGYGPGTARVLRCIRRGEAWSSATRAVHPQGSYGNGAAMRSPVLALFYARDHDAVVDAARLSAQVTHGHPLAIEGAVLISLATHHVLRGKPAGEALEAVRSICREREILDRLRTVASWLRDDAAPPPCEVAEELGNGMTAASSCATALYIALRHLPGRFEDMMGFVIQCKGDVDTIGAMAGALWGAAQGAGALPVVRLERREHLEEIGRRLYARSAGARLLEAGADG